MNGYETHDEQQPVTWIRGQPIYAAHFVVVVFVVSMLVTTILRFSGADAVLGALSFSSAAVLRGEIWRIFSYGFVNPPSIWFAIDMLMLVWFGRELEKFFGRKKFLQFYAGLYLLKPLLFTTLGVWFPLSFYGQSGSLPLFVAFATLYPNAMMMLNLLAKWIAVILVSLYALIALSNRDTISLISLLATSGYAFAFVRYQQGHLSLPSFHLPKRQPKLTVLPGGRDHAPTRGPSSSSAKTAAPSASRPVRDTTTSEMDALLDKIARSGMGSLTTDERARLDAAAKAHTQRKFGR